MVRLCIIALAITLSPAWSGAAPPRAIVFYADGGVKKPGFDFIKEAVPWDVWYQTHCTRHPAIWLHNPMGNCNLFSSGQTVMQVDQGQELETLAAANPDDKELANRADLQLFVDTFRNRPAWQELYIYVGSADSIDWQPGDTPKKVAERLYESLWWAREACPTGIGLDATSGNKPRDAWTQIIWGNRGAEASLIKRLRSDGIEVIIEPAPLVEAKRLHDYWSVWREKWWVDNVGSGTVLGPFFDPHRMPRTFRIIETATLAKYGAAQCVDECEARGEIALVNFGWWRKEWER